MSNGCSLKQEGFGFKKMQNNTSFKFLKSDEISEKYIKEYKEDMASIGVETPDAEPRVTEHLEQITALIEKILEKGFAYRSGNNVFFSVRKFPDYGKLSGISLDHMLEEVRIDVNEEKEDPLNFALWISRAVLARQHPCSSRKQIIS